MEQTAIHRDRCPVYGTDGTTGSSFAACSVGIEHTVRDRKDATVNFNGTAETVVTVQCFSSIIFKKRFGQRDIRRCSADRRPVPTGIVPGDAAALINSAGIIGGCRPAEDQSADHAFFIHKDRTAILNGKSADRSTFSDFHRVVSFVREFHILQGRHRIDQFFIQPQGDLARFKFIFVFDNCHFSAPSFVLC